MLTLRPYQIAAIRALWASWKDNAQAAPILVCPTGSGKSLLCSSIIAQISAKHPHARFLVVTHTKEIVRQNSEELQRLMPNEAIGVYSAGLGSKRIQRVTFANVQSIYKVAKTLTASLLIIDESHLVSKDENSMYQKLVKNLQVNNPNIKIMGLTATPMRMDQGSLIAEGSTFTEIAYEISIKELIEQGYLCPLVSMAKQAVDLTGVKTSGYDYNQGDLQFAFNKQDIIDAQVKEIIAGGADRKHWLLFCSGIEHAQTVTTTLRAQGIAADYVTGEMPTMNRDMIINRFMSGETQALCNVGVLTTGFNFKPIDMIVLLRATKSASLYIQMVGRGTRTAEGKLNAKILDFGGNIQRHGPIDLIKIGAKKERKAEASVAPHKKCPICDCVVPIGVKVCPSCDYPYPEPAAELEIVASEAPIVSIDEERARLAIIDMSVTNRIIVRHRGKDGKPDTLRITYSVGSKAYSDYFCFEHSGFPRRIAEGKWLATGGQHPVPRTVQEALDRQHELPTVTRVKVDTSKKFPEILSLTVTQTPVVEYDENDLNL